MAPDGHLQSQPIVILGIIWLAITIKTSLSPLTLAGFLLWMLVTVCCGVFFAVSREKTMHGN